MRCRVCSPLVTKVNIFTFAGNARPKVNSFTFQGMRSAHPLGREEGEGKRRGKGREGDGRGQGAIRNATGDDVDGLTSTLTRTLSLTATYDVAPTVDLDVDLGSPSSASRPPLTPRDRDVSAPPADGCFTR